jgi:predicted dinucleotide-binding enzyme
MWKSLLANTRGREAVEPIAKELGGKVVARSLDEALQSDVIFLAVRFLNFKDVGQARPDWTGKIIVDVTNAASRFTTRASIRRLRLSMAGTIPAFAAGVTRHSCYGCSAIRTAR